MSHRIGELIQMWAYMWVFHWRGGDVRCRIVHKSAACTTYDNDASEHRAFFIKMKETALVSIFTKIQVRDPQFSIISLLGGSTVWQMDRLNCNSLLQLDWVSYNSRTTPHPPPTLLPLLCCWAWMSQTGLGLNWADEFQHLACICSSRSFGCSWWFPVDPQRLNCSGFGPCLHRTLRAWCSGACLPQLGLSVKASCDTQDWLILSLRTGRETGAVTTWME